MDNIKSQKFAETQVSDTYLQRKIPVRINTTKVRVSTYE